MSLPHESVFEFYEGDDRTLYTPVTGINLNKANNQLLENDLNLQEQIDNLQSIIVTDDQSGQLFDGALWMIDTTTADPVTLLDDWVEEQSDSVKDYNPFNARKYGASAFFLGKHWVFGGETSGGTLAEIWSSDDGYDWTLHTSAADFGTKVHHKVVVLGANIYLIGGNRAVSRDHLGDLPDYIPAHDDNGKEVWRSPDGINWTMIHNGTDFSGGGSDDSYADYAVCVFDDGGGDEIWMFGGGRYQHTTSNLDGQSITEFRDFIWHSPDGINWTQENPLGAGWYDFSLGQAVVHKGEIYLVGGRGDGTDETNLVRKSPDGINWTSVGELWRPDDDATTQSRYFTDSGLWSDGSNLYLYFDRATWRSTNDGISWDIISFNTENNVGYPASTVYDGTNFWMYGGQSRGFGVSNEVWTTADGTNWKKITNEPHQYTVAPIPPSESRQPLSDGSKMWVYNTGFTDISRFSNYSVPDDTANEESSNDEKRAALRFKNSVFSTTDGKTWTYEGFHDLTPSASDATNRDRSPRLQDKFVYYNGKIRYIGRIDGNRIGAWSSADGLAFSEDDGDISGITHHSRFSLCEFDGYLWIVGGNEESEGIVGGYLSGVWRSPDGASWTSVFQNNPIDGILGHSAIAFDDGGGEQMYVVGGYDGVAGDAVWSTSDGSNWTKRTTNIFPSITGQYLGELTVHDGKLYHLGGNSSSGLDDELWATEDGTNWTRVINNGFEYLRPFEFKIKPVLFNGYYYLFTGYSEIDGSSNGNYNYQYYSSNMEDWKPIRESRDRWIGVNGHTSYQFDSKVWIQGGRTDEDGTLELKAYHTTDGLAWTELDQFFPAEHLDLADRYNHRVIDFGGTLFMTGGIVDGDYSDIVFSSTDGITWKEAGNLPAAVNGHTISELGGELYVCGGRNIPAGANTNRVFKSADGITWSEVVQVSPFIARRNHEALVFDSGGGDKLYVIAGVDSGGSVWSTTDGATWVEETANLGTGSRTNFAAVSALGRIWVMGGEQNGVSVNTTWSSADGATWRQDVVTTKFDARKNHVAEFFNDGSDDKIWIFGGRDDLDYEFNDSWSNDVTTAGPAYGRNTYDDPKDNDVIRFKDVGNNLGVTAAYIGYNGTDLINNVAANYDITVDGSEGGLVFTTGKGWRIFTGG